MAIGDDLATTRRTSVVDDRLAEIRPKRFGLTDPTNPTGATFTSARSGIWGAPNAFNVEISRQTRHSVPTTE
jgi:hypothetical protein